MPSFATRFRHRAARLRGSAQRSGWLRLPESAAGDAVVKPAAYLPIYEQLLAPLRNRAFTLLELGVWGGHSLEMWRDAFPRATIIGVDLVLPDVELGPRVHLIRGDQVDGALMRHIRDDYARNGFDVIIDDASHIGITTARSLQALYTEHLCQGGLYCIEDWGTGYLPSWHDGGPISSLLDIQDLDSAATAMTADVARPIPMSSHDLGMVGLVKRLIDHAAAGTIRVVQGDAVRETLPIESMTVWDGIVALRKQVT
jgi:hypothetical protein